jgi:4a-hydroxytetrahydrobiopterin dehydratase
MTPSSKPPVDIAELASMHCQAGAPRLTPGELATHMQMLADWSQTDDGIEKMYSFADFHATIGFVNALAWIANREDHHPDLRVSYNRCVVAWSTHDAGGVTRNDFICAAKTDRLFAG